MNNWYIQKVLCFSCNAPCKLRQFQFCGNGTIKLIGWCDACGRESTFQTEAESLVIWAKHHDNPFPTECDKKWLHELLISWESPKQLAPPT